jgi:hypothetical protein
MEVRRLVPGPNVVVLAQASMAPASVNLKDLAVPVLSSPELGVRVAIDSVWQVANKLNMALA